MLFSSPPKDAIVITAATGALGEAISFELAKQGCNLVLAGRNRDKLDALQRKLLQYNKKIQVYPLVIDFTDINSVQSFKQLSSSSIRGVVLMGPRPTIPQKGVPEGNVWAQVFAETFIAPLEVIRQCDHALKPNASVVVISGNTARSYNHKYPNVNVMRMIWSGQIKNLMYHYASRKIRFNVVAPGVIMTSYHQKRIQAKADANNVTYPEQLALETQATPLGQFGKAEDVASLVSFLLADKAGHVNGMTIALDGGESNAY